MTKTKITPEEALAYHFEPRPGKFDIVPSTPMATQRDLSLAYSPGVAVPVLAIAERPETAYDYTVKGNMVAVITNGTAILGLGNLGALASKPGLFTEPCSAGVDWRFRGPRRPLSGALSWVWRWLAE